MNTYSNHSPIRQPLIRALCCGMLLLLLSLVTASVGATATPIRGATYTSYAVPSDVPQIGPFVVNTTSDAGDGVCGQEECTLREAIVAANTKSLSDQIAFNLTGSPVITPSSALPSITGQVVIDGTTQPGASCAVPTVVINGSQAGANANGLDITAGSSTVKGLIIINFAANGIRLASGGNNTVRCSWIGVDAANNAAGNGLAGIRVERSSNNVIGGNDPATTRNILGGNTFQGIIVEDNDATNNTIQNNYIGIGANGTTRLGNKDGIYINNQPGNTIVDNTLSANTNNGIYIGGANAVGTIIQGNILGSNASNAPLGNYSNGIVVDGAVDTVIGGTAASDANIIGDNGNYGILIYTPTTAGTQIKGNYIGVARNGMTSIPNFFDGIRAVAGSGVIGGTGAGEGNLIAFNKNNGILLTSTLTSTASGYTIVGNSVFSNIKLGIDLDPALQGDGDGVTANDAGDADSGPNTLQNYPTLKTVTSDSNQTLVNGSLNSTPNTQFKLDFYSEAACDATGFGEGKTYLGQKSVTTDGSGNVTFSALAFNTSVPQGHKLTATATNPGGSTSEFSECVTIGTLPSVSINDMSITEGNAGAKQLAFNVTLSAAVGSDVVVQYTTSDSTASTPIDYVAATGTVTIPAGQTSVQLLITVNGDTMFEQDETFLVNLLGASNASISDDSGQGTIINDDTMPTISIADTSVVEGNTGTRTLVFTVTLSNASSQPISVNYATQNGSASAPGDYLAASGTLTFEIGETSKTISITVNGDAAFEGSETVILTLSSPVNATISDGTAIGTIIDDDAKLRIYLPLVLKSS